MHSQNSNRKATKCLQLKPIPLVKLRINSKQNQPLVSGLLVGGVPMAIEKSWHDWYQARPPKQAKRDPMEGFTRGDHANVLLPSPQRCEANSRPHCKAAAQCSTIPLLTAPDSEKGRAAGGGGWEPTGQPNLESARGLYPPPALQIELRLGLARPGYQSG